jgi:hypothetical protein
MIGMGSKLSPKKFKAAIRPFLGMKISRAWRGYGSAAFFELGVFTFSEIKTRYKGSQQKSFDSNLCTYLGI